MQRIWKQAGILTAVLVWSCAALPAENTAFGQHYPQAHGGGYPQPGMYDQSAMYGMQQGMPAGYGMQGGYGMPGQTPPPGMYGTSYDQYARTWEGNFKQPTAAMNGGAFNAYGPNGSNRAYPTHRMALRYHAPRNLVYPQQNQPAAVVQYPYYTFKGPTDFFRNEPVPVTRY